VKEIPWRKTVSVSDTEGAFTAYVYFGYVKLVLSTRQHATMKRKYYDPNGRTLKNEAAVLRAINKKIS